MESLLSIYEHHGNVEVALEITDERRDKNGEVWVSIAPLRKLCYALVNKQVYLERDAYYVTDED